MKHHPTNMDQKSTPPKPPDKTGNPTKLGKRHCPSPTDSESDTDNAPTSWPRFLVIKPNNKENTFLTTSPFAINKALLGISGEMKSVRKLGSGDLMVETSRKSHSDNLLKCKMFINFPVTVSPHRTLNSSRGIIRHREFKFCSDEEVQENLFSKGVTDVKRISVTRDGKKCPTNTFILTFNNSTLPSSIKIAWFNVAVEPYIPNPLRCFNCQRFGHHKDKCKCKLVCARCGGESHEADGCTKNINCFNCKGEHFASAKTCPKWISEKEIQTIKFTKNISYPEARKIVEGRTPSGLSYAAVARPSVLKSFTSSFAQTDSVPFTLFNSNSSGSLMSQPGPSKDHTGSFKDHLGSSQNQHKPCSKGNQTGYKNNQKHSSGSQSIPKENKETPPKDNNSSRSESKKIVSTESCKGEGKTNSKSIIKKSKQDGGSKPPIAPKPTLAKLSNRFDVLMDTSDPISPACIPPKPIVPRNPILAP